MENTISTLKSKPTRNITLFHHNDTDGLSSGTILLSAFEEVGYEVSRFSLEKPYPQILEKVLAKSNQIIIFADFAGRIAPLISRLNQKKNFVIILDHHPAEAVEDTEVVNLDAELFGLKGDQDISASAVCFLFADALLRSYGKRGTAYAHLGSLGAIGDGFFVDGALSGVNREILKTAVELGLVRVDTSAPTIRSKEKSASPTASAVDAADASEETYYIKLGGIEYPAAEICNILDTLGGVGYYQDGTARGIEICRSGISPEQKEYIQLLNEKKEAIFSREIEHLKRTIHTTEHIQWFTVEDRFQPMGIKMIGVLCTRIKEMEFLDTSKYLAGFQLVPDEVPGFGKISFNSIKISMRVSEFLTEQIRAERIPGLNSFLPEATGRLGGFSDACHRLSAATIIKPGQEALLIQEMENILSARMVNT
jgi:single-stranded-DNA-specific exonuclease